MKQYDLKELRVGILGIGTVGGGTYNVLTRNAAEIKRRTGVAINVTQVADRNIGHAKMVTNGNCVLTTDAFAIVNNPEIDVVVELIGGYTLSKELVLKAIENGKHVVTANKALLALHGNEIFAAAQKAGVIVAFEAAVAGGIPILKRCVKVWVQTILNGLRVILTGRPILYSPKCVKKAWHLLMRI